jgi:hypothetical protein
MRRAEERTHIGKSRRSRGARVLRSSGPDFHVSEPVKSDGLMHHYVLVSRFGDFPAYVRTALAIRVREVSALKSIAKTSDVDVVFELAATNDYRVAGGHLSFPGIGHVRAEKTHYVWVPTSYNIPR